MTQFTRRSLTCGLGAGLAAPSLLLGAAHAQTESDEDIADIMLDTLGTSMEQEFGFSATAAADRRRLLDRIATWTDATPPSEPQWPAYQRTVDYAPHIPEAQPGATVTLTADLIRRAAQRFNYALSTQQRLIFGIRGAQANGDRSGVFSNAITIRHQKPDHLNFRCLIGVLDHANGQIAVYPGSTVPEFAHIRTNLLRIGGCNLSPPGFYRFTVGLHGVTKRFKQPGAFLQGAPSLVLRTTRTGIYDVSDQDCAWDMGTFGNNIHSAIFTGSAPKFSSAGCQIVRGSYNRNGWLPTGDYASFRVAAGLSPRTQPSTDLTSPEDGVRFQYALFAFSELAAEANNAAGARQYLRYGSTGARVNALQTRVGVAPSGRFDANTMMRWLEYQQRQGQQEYPVALA